MANRFWVGGGGNWNDTAHWSTSSGGAGGASVPAGSGTNFFTGSISASDSVIFDANSFAAPGTIDLGGGFAYTNGISASALSHAVNITNGTLGVSGNSNMTLSANLTISADVYSIGNKTLTTNAAVFTGKLWSNGNFTLGDNLISPLCEFFQYNLTGGNTFTSNSHTITVAQFLFDADGTSPAGSITINLGTSVITTHGFHVGDASQVGGIPGFTLNGSNATVFLSPISSNVNDSYMTIGASVSGSIGTLDVNINGSFVTYFANVDWGFTVSGNFTLHQGLTFQHLGNMNVGGNFSAVGTSTDRIFLDGQISGIITVAGTATTEYVTASRNTAAGAGSPFLDNHGIDSGNNVNWVFSPVAAFTGTPLSGDVALPVAFTDDSTQTPTSWLWDFGDGSTSTTQNPSHTYASAGVYTVTLTATNAAGTDTITKVAYIAAANSSLFLQNVYMIASEPTGTVQMINIGKSDNGTPIYYELETQELEFSDLSHLKGISDEIVVFTNFGTDSKLQASTDTQDLKDINIELGERVNFGKNIDLEGHFVTFRWFGISSLESPVFEGLYLENIIDKGMTQP